MTGDRIVVVGDAGVEPHLEVSSGLPTGTIVILVDGERRTMLTERGANSSLSVGAVTDELLAGAGVLHISGYSILDGFGTPGTRDLIGRATAAGVPVSVTPGSSGYIEDFGAAAFLEAIAGTTILFPNLAEGELLSGETKPERIGAALRERFEVVVLTMGAEGLMVFEGKTHTRVPAPLIEHIEDPTGAGDALAAGFLDRWITDHDALAAAEAGVFVAARAIMVIGGRPPI
jgi:sugar/nucleoside kinase (ribokinase family)